jgi:Fe-S-cluster-containing hydrogenase component 2
MDFTRRDLFKFGGKLLVLASAGATLEQITGAAPPSEAYRMADHWWGMIVDIDLCIGCGNCVRACSKENDVPQGYFRTWVERYQIEEGKQPHVESPNGAIDGFPPSTRTDLKSFYVPKLCNQCADSPCVQVCPVGATFVSPDGVVLVDESYCLGCRYCVQASLLPPHHQGPDHGLLRELSHRRPSAGGLQEPERPCPRNPAHQHGPGFETLHGHRSQGLLQKPGWRSALIGAIDDTRR